MSMHERGRGAEGLRINGLRLVVWFSIGALQCAGQAIYFAGDFYRFKQDDGTVLNMSGVGQLMNNDVSTLGQGVSLPAEGIALGSHTLTQALYIGGSFHLANGEERSRITKAAASMMDEVDKGVSHTVYSIRVHQPSGLLYIGGVFADATGIKVGRVTAWNGTEWDQMGGGVSNPPVCRLDGSSSTEDAVIYDLELLGGDAVAKPQVFVGGRFRLAGLDSEQVTAHHIARWDPQAEQWSALCDPNPPTRCDTGGIGQGPKSSTDNSIGELEYVFALAVHESSNRLFVGGIFSTAGQKFDRIQSLAVFNLANSAWGRVGRGIAGANPTVHSLHIAGDQLWVAGFFSHVAKQNEDIFSDGTRSPSVAAYGLSTGTWTGTGTGLEGAIVHSVTVDSNGVVYCGGSFTEVGGQPTAGLAKYEAGQWSSVGQEILSETGGPGTVYSVHAGPPIPVILPARILASDGSLLRANFALASVVSLLLMSSMRCSKQHY